MKKISKLQTAKQERERERYEEELVKEVNEDFEKRRAERKSRERQWELNMNFLAGNQYCDLNSRGEIESENKSFYWQNRGVFNHIAPILDSRMAKFSRISSDVSVRPKSDDDKDVANAMVAEKFLAHAFKNCDFDGVARKVTAWSETCGTGFYKVVWNNQAGNLLGNLDGKEVYEGDAEIIPVSPFEIFPDSLYNQEIKDCKSIIHARAVSVDEIYEKYGVKVSGDRVSVYNLNGKNGVTSNDQEAIDDASIVIERYERASAQYPNGRLLTVAGGKLLYAGDLPYISGDNGQREFPFVKQTSLVLAGNFFGVSVIDRLIPIQRAFNAVKNRKHEFMNRLTMGVMTVEDGSVDVDDLAEDGLCPGKVLVYRQGSKAPEIMSDASLPTDFNQEEEKLINEFVIVSGVSDVTSSSSNASLSSGTALQILVEQDNSRLVMTAEEIRRSFLCVARKVIRLYAQFSEGIRAISVKGRNNKTKTYYADGNSLNSDDVYLESENELLYTESQRKEIVFKLYSSGLLSDENGKLRPATKEKVLSLLGYKELDYQKGLAHLQEEKAQNENEDLRNTPLNVDEIDDHAVHIDEHVRYVLSEYKSLSEEQKQRYYQHINQHKTKINQIEQGE
ncbi:MAG: hypothetical protein IJA88_00690 [Clostridia bacterium]|nr:hypothetical protein [Clostridia bacterium]